MHVSAGSHPETINQGKTNWYCNVPANPALLHTVPMHFSDFSHFLSQELCHLPGWPTINVTCLMYSAFFKDLASEIHQKHKLKAYYMDLKKRGKLNVLLDFSSFMTLPSTSVKRHLAGLIAASKSSSAAFLQWEHITVLTPFCDIISGWLRGTDVSY